MSKIVTIVGARPQFVKAAVVSRALSQHKAELQEVMVHTGQHYDPNMSQLFFDELAIPAPHHHLGVGGGSHGQNTGRMIEKIEAILVSEKPACLLVYGDTDSTLAGTLAAVKLHIPVAHVEAGLRSFNRRMPEEINRVVVDHVSTILFTTSDVATQNLQREGIQGQSVCQVGDVMFDAAVFYGERARRSSTVLSRLGLDPKAFAMATVHRQENVDDRTKLHAILEGFAQAPCTIVWPLHPRTRKRIAEMGLTLPASVRVVDPVGYLDMARLEAEARFILTDSGGVQKEAFFHKVPCITLREETEWTETLTGGANRLVGSDTATIVEAMQTISPFPEATHPYGSGTAGLHVADLLAARFAGS